jgi:LysR family nitrogen assimilation transcriptional regulator
MQKLEDELQEQLLIRHSRGIELTDAGQRLLGHARSILHQVDLAREDVRARNEPEGLVRVGMPRSMSEILAVELILAVASAAPAVSIRIVEHFSENLYAQMRERELDIALTYSTESSIRVITEDVLLQRLSLVSPVNSGVVAAGEIAFAEVVTLPLILGSPAQAVRKLVESTATETGAVPNVVHEIDSLQTTMNMVAGGLGHTILPATVVCGAVESGLVETRAIVAPEMIRRLHIARPAQCTPTRAQSIVRNLLKQLLQQHVQMSATDAPS